MPTNKKHVIQIYLNEDEYKFLKEGSKILNKSMAQTLLHFADFYNRMEEAKHETDVVKIKGLEIPPDPFEDYEEF